MSRLLRRLMSVLVVIAVVAVGVVVYRHGSSDDPASPTSYSGRSRALDPNPDLTKLKGATGVRDCAAGPGGGDLPAVTIPCLGGGQSVDLSTLRGPMLISIWASYCGPCRQEMPVLQAFDQAHGTQVPVLGVDFLDLYPASALDKMKSRGATYPSLADPSGILQQQKAFASVTHLPVLIFLDAKGRIAYEYVGGVDSDSQLRQLVHQHLGVDL